MNTETYVSTFIGKMKAKTSTVGIIGLGYVGLPLAQAFCAQSINVIGFDIDQEKINLLKTGKSYIKHISNEVIASFTSNGLFNATSDFSRLTEVDVIIICVPTPLSKYREPDLGPVLTTGHSIAQHLLRGQFIVLESSTYPGTTDIELAAVLEKSGLKVNKDFFLAYSPEREDPGNMSFSTATIPKIVGADTEGARQMAVALYEGVIESVIAVQNSRTAEAVKLTENIFRSVNIALVNELKVIFDAMGIDVWDVINGAATKPFGYMPFYPGPGLGGHCIPIDPFYLTYKAREFDVPTRFIELAGEINTNMPHLVISKLSQALSLHAKKSVNGSKILIVGMAYKKNIDDMRESPSLVITELLENLGACVDYYDPFVPVIPRTRHHNKLAGRKSKDWNKIAIDSYDAILISTAHDNIEYQLLADQAQLIVDTRNVMSGIQGNATVVKA